MKLKLLFIILLLFSTCAYANQFTGNFNLEIPATGLRDWGSIISKDIISLDSIIYMVSRDISIISNDSTAQDIKLQILTNDAVIQDRKLKILTDDAVIQDSKLTILTNDAVIQDLKLTIISNDVGNSKTPTYITQTSNTQLTNEQAIGGLASGIMRVANTTGVITSLTDILPIASGGTNSIIGYTVVTNDIADIKTYRALTADVVPYVGASKAVNLGSQNLSTTGKITTPNLSSSTGQISLDVQTLTTDGVVSASGVKARLSIDVTSINQDVEFFKSAPIDNAADGKSLYVYRKAAEGTDYVQIYTDQNRRSFYNFTGTNGMFFIGAGYSAPIDFITNVNFGSAGYGLSTYVRQHGVITAVTDTRYIQWLVDDTDDYFHLSRQDSNILGFKCDMPMTITETTEGLNLNAGSANAQLLFGWSGSVNSYRHAIKTQHHGSSNPDNSMEFFVWTTADAITAIPSVKVMSLVGNKSVITYGKLSSDNLTSDTVSLPKYYKYSERPTIAHTLFVSSDNALWFYDGTGAGGYKKISP